MAVTLAPRRDRRQRLAVAERLDLVDDDLDMTAGDIAEIRADVKNLLRVATGLLVSIILVLIGLVANLAAGAL